MKILILAGGKGQRMAETTKEKNKCLIEIEKIHGKPLIEYSLDYAVELSDISGIVIVVGYKAKDIMSKYGDQYKGKKIEYVFQPDQRGLVHAIECAEKSIGGENFVLMLGDELMVSPRHIEMIEKFNKEGLFGVCGGVFVSDKNLVRKTYDIIQEENGIILRLVEKPSDPVNNIMGTGNCVFRNEIFNYIKKTPINPERGEKELASLVQCAIDSGRMFKSFNICDKYFNINCKEDLLMAKQFLTNIS